MEKISRKGFLKIAAAAAMSGVTAAGLAACNAASGSSGASSAAGIYTPGTYTATAKGMSEITATVTFDANTITKVELDLSGETESIGGAAKDKLIEQVMNAQTSQIDGVTGATVTSKAVQNAVADCIRQASGGAINPAEQTTEETASTADWLGELIQAEIVSILTRLGPNGFHRGHYASAARIVQEAVTAPTLPDFITTPAQDVLNALD